MAIAFEYLKGMADDGLLEPGTRFLDIGCSNLYNASPDELVAFMARFDVEDGAFAERLAAQSAAKTAFAGELIDRCGMHYEAIDFAVDYKTTKFDLNRDSLPDKFRGAFDLVVNFGTTEHVINQANSFTVIHDAVKPGGVIYHQLPAAGFFDHCYFLYTGRFFFDMAGYNEYEVIRAWLAQAADSDIRKTFQDYSSYFPVLAEAPDPATPTYPDTGFNVMYRKVKDVAFRYPMELSTAYTKPEIEADDVALPEDATPGAESN